MFCSGFQVISFPGICRTALNLEVASNHRNKVGSTFQTEKDCVEECSKRFREVKACEYLDDGTCYAILSPETNVAYGLEEKDDNRKGSCVVIQQNGNMKWII